MFEPAPTPSFPPPPSPGTGTPNQRYAYLVGRLRARQITMEEATELFSMQQSMIRSSPPSSSAPDSPANVPSDAGSSSAPALVQPPLEDALWMTLLAMGAGAGLLAAVLKRATDGPKPPLSPSSPKAGERQNG